jgi:hypothetical protein
MTGKLPQTRAHAFVAPSHMYVSAGQAYNNAMRADLGCMDFDDDAHGHSTAQVRLTETGEGMRMNRI